MTEQAEPSSLRCVVASGAGCSWARWLPGCWFFFNKSSWVVASLRLIPGVLKECFGRCPCSVAFVEELVFRASTLPLLLLSGDGCGPSGRDAWQGKGLCEKLRDLTCGQCAFCSLDPQGRAWLWGQDTWLPWRLLTQCPTRPRGPPERAVLGAF